MKKKISIFAFLSAFIFICGCQPKIHSRGNLTLAEKIDTFVVGKTKNIDVYEACGTPSMRRDRLTWIYIGAKSEEIAFRNIQMKDKLVVRFIFDEKGILRKIEKIDEQSQRHIEPDSDITGLLKK